MIKKNVLKGILSLLIMVSLFFSFNTVTTFATSFNSFQQGTYDIKTNLSCYVTAMGGVEFGGPLLQSSKATISSNGNATITLYLTKNSTTIYGVTCDTFVDTSPSYVTEDRGVANGTIGIYSQEGELITQGVSYTLSSDTAENSAKEQVNYVDSITLPLSYKSDSYNLTLYVNSNVMGLQFCNSNNNAQLTTYPATLTVDWSSIPLGSEVNNTNNESISNNSSSSSTNSNNSNSSTNSSNNNSSNTVANNSASVNNESNTDNSNSDIAEKENSKAEVENMDGLSIYKVEENESSNSDIDETPTYSADLNTPVIIAIISISFIMIISGITLMTFSSRRKLNEKTNK